MYEVSLEVFEIQENWKKKKKRLFSWGLHSNRVRQTTNNKYNKLYSMLESSSDMKRKSLAWKLGIWNRISDMSVA